MTPERRAEIEAALAAATPGPWEISLSESSEQTWGVTADWQDDEADYRLIANAPTYLRELLDALDAAEKRNDEYVRAEKAWAWDEGAQSHDGPNPYRSQP